MLVVSRMLWRGRAPGQRCARAPVLRSSTGLVSCECGTSKFPPKRKCRSVGLGIPQPNARSGVVVVNAATCSLKYRCCSSRPTFSNAGFQLQACTLCSMLDHNLRSHVMLDVQVGSRAYCGSAYCCFKCDLNPAKTYASNGCNSHVIFAGTYIIHMSCLHAWFTISL